METAKVFHISLDSPDNTPFPSFPNTEFGKEKEGQTDNITLLKIRQRCKVSKKYKFSIDGKNAIDDDKSLGYYISVTPENHAKLYEGEKKQEPSGAISIPSIIIRLILATQNPVRENVAQANLIEGLRATLAGTKSDLQQGKLSKVSDTVDKLAALDMSFAATPAAGTTLPEPADLTEEQWEKILFNNQALHGYNSNEHGVVRAAKRAFMIKRPVPGNKQDALEMLYHEGIPGTPSFTVYDDSGVTVTQLQSAFQENLAANSFHSKTVEASVSGSGFGMSASVSASYAKEQAGASESENKTTADSMHVSYNFPRVIVNLEPETLQLSPECKKDAMNVADDSDKKEFLLHYGERLPSTYNWYHSTNGFGEGTTFATSVTLGGRLHSTRKLVGKESSNLDEVKTELRAAAGASFSSPWVSGSASYAQKDVQAQSTAQSTMNKSLSLTWDARGGDTLLCSNPPAWASSVKDYRLWRVMDQSVLVSLESMISAVDFAAGENIKTPSKTKSVTHKWNSEDEQHLHDLYDEPEDKSKPESELMKKIRKYFESGQFDLKAYNKFTAGFHNNLIEAGQKWPSLSQPQKGDVGWFMADHGLLWQD